MCWYRTARSTSAYLPPGLPRRKMAIIRLMAARAYVSDTDRVSVAHLPILDKESDMLRRFSPRRPQIANPRWLALLVILSFAWLFCPQRGGAEVRGASVGTGAVKSNGSPIGERAVAQSSGPVVSTFAGVCAVRFADGPPPRPSSTIPEVSRWMRPEPSTPRTTPTTAFGRSRQMGPSRPWPAPARRASPTAPPPRPSSSAPIA